jgi:hypothetical protein
MARTGFAVAGLLGIAGFALMLMGFSPSFGAAQSMYFMAGAILLGAGGICASITAAAPGARMVSSEPSVSTSRRADPAMGYNDPFTAAPSSAGNSVLPVIPVAAVVAYEAQAAAPEPDLIADPGQAPMHDPVMEPMLDLHGAEPDPTPEPVVPVFDLPPLKPRFAPADLEPVAEEPALVAPAPIEPVVMAAPEPARPSNQAPTRDEPETLDAFDLEAAIAAELGVSSLPPEHTSPVEAAPADVEEIFAVPVHEVAADHQPETESPMEEPTELVMQEEAAESQSHTEAEFVAADVTVPEPSPLPAAERIVVGSYESAGVLYTLFEDGSVTAEANGVVESYESLDALRAAFDHTPA